MKFHELLNSYISKYNISGKDLAKELNISESKMSRYRTGKSLPPLDSEYIGRITESILKYSNDTTLTYEKVYYDLSKSLPVDSSTLNSKNIIQNFNQIAVIVCTFICGLLNVIKIFFKRVQTLEQHINHI